MSFYLRKIGLLFFLFLSQVVVSQTGVIALGGLIARLTAMEVSSSSVSSRKFNFHAGTAQLKTSETLTGKFKCLNKPSGDGKSGVVYYIPNGGTDQEIKFVHEDFNRITLEGVFPDIQYRQDSSELFYIDEYKRLFRKVIDGKLQFYSAFYNIDEDFINLKYRKYLIYSDENGYKEFQTPRSLATLLSDQTYFSQFLDVIYRRAENDYPLIVLMLSAYNSDNPGQLLDWKEMKISLRDGTELSGYGIVQAVNLLDHHQMNSYIHFHSGKKFYLFGIEDIKTVETQNRIYQPIYDVSSYHHFFAAKWTFNQLDYYVGSKRIGNNNFFQTNETDDGEELVFFTENKKGKFKQYKKNTKEMRKGFVEYKSTNE